MLFGKNNTTVDNGSYSEAAICALVYRVCGQFAEECPDKIVFLEALKIFIEEDLADEGTKALFIFASDKLRELEYGQIKERCSRVPKVIAEYDRSAWKALVDMELDQMLRGL